MKNEVRATGVLASCVFFAACSDAPPSLGQIAVRDSAGITIVSNGTLDSSLDALASPSPILQIGVVAGPEEYQFFQVTGLRRLRDGGFSVLNRGDNQLRIYNADGSHRATAGGEGDGPEEFGFPRALTLLRGDTIQVQDWFDRVLFTSDGRFVRRMSHNPQRLTDVWREMGRSSEGGGWLPDSTLLAPLYDWEEGELTPGPLYRPPILLAKHHGRDVSVVDTLGHFGGILQQFLDVGPRVSSVVPPFNTETSWEVGSDGTVVVGDNEHPQVERFHPDGSHSIIRWDAETEVVTDAEVEKWKDERREFDWVQERLAEVERGWAAMDVPDTKPFYWRIAAGGAGTAWVLLSNYYLAGPTTLMSFGPDGAFRGAATIPVRFRPYDSGPGWVAGVMFDENDVEFIQVYATR